TATAEKDGCTIGTGSLIVPGVANGSISPAQALVVHSIACIPVTNGTGGAPGAGGGGGTTPGTGGTGTGGVIGTGVGGTPGTGGVIGAGIGGTPGTGGVITTTGTGGAGACGDLIDDMESNTGRICEGNGRAGHWFT